MFAYADVQVWADYLEIAEDLNMRTLEIVAAAGTALALAGQSLFLEPLQNSSD